MSIFKKFPSNHLDYIHDLSFDHYGRKLASCSSDRKIKIWELNELNEWILCNEWSAHQGTIWKLSWAHPEFGHLLASCSFDRTVAIWEDQDIHYSNITDNNHLIKSNQNESWKQIAQLVDSKESVQDIKFAPRHLGLRLATGSADGFVRMYEAVDITSLSQWPLQEEFLADKDGITCLSWNPARFEAPMICVGGKSSGAKVWGYNNTYHRWQVLVELNSQQIGIQAIAWAPTMGRSFHLIATATKDSVHIWKLKLLEGLLQYEAEEVLIDNKIADNKNNNNNNNGSIRRVEWNVTGTMLATSDDDGIVRMWKSDYQGTWSCIGIITENETTPNEET